jgi:polysaccharide biosynthesis protein PslG
MNIFTLIWLSILCLPVFRAGEADASVFSLTESYTDRPVKSDPDALFGPPKAVCSGVNIHFTKGHQIELDLISSAGFSYIRTDFVWQDIEYEKGFYNWDAYDALTRDLRERGLRAIFILDYSNSIYEDTVVSKDPITGEPVKGIAAPTHSESISAFVRWAAEAAVRFKDYDIVWEIWNEPNISFWMPVANAAQYNRLAMEVCKALKSAVPESIIIGPATSGIPFPFLESALSSGILEYLDGVSVHPYRDYSLAPESAASDYRKLRDLINHYSPSDRKGIPILSSEWGYASCPKGVDMGKQAALAVRMQLANLLNEIPVSIWYDWKNDGLSPTNFEHNCGTVTYELAPKPAYIALKTMNEQLKGLSLAHRIELESENDFALLFMNRKGIFKVCAWTTDKPHSIKIDMIVSDPDGLKAVDGYGNPLPLSPGSDGLIIDLSELPEYISLPCGVRVD